MNSDELIGKVTALYLQKYIEERDSDGLARFALNRLSAPLMASIASAIQNDPQLCDQVEIKLPKSELAEYGLNDSVLTEESAVHWRNTTISDVNKKILLIANIGNDQTHSLGTVAAIGAAQLRHDADLWIESSGVNSELLDKEKAIFRAAIKAANDISSTLSYFSNYVLEVVNQIPSLGVVRACEYALPELLLPRNSERLTSISDSRLGQVGAWTKQFKTIQQKDGCYLLKEMPNGEIIDQKQLFENLEKLKSSNSYSDDVLKVMEEFIVAPAGWNSSAKSLAELEWSDASGLFNELSKKKDKLGERTLKFFNDDYAGLLSDEEISTLEKMDRHNVKNTNEEDEQEFYKTYASKLAENPALIKEWDKLVYGKAQEYSDFFYGIVATFERLLNRCSYHGTDYTLELSIPKSSKMSFWRDQKDAGAIRYFILHYRGFEKYFGNLLKIDFGHLFERVLEDDQFEKDSTSKSATSISFNAKLIKNEDNSEISACQFIWKSEPYGIGLGLYSNLSRIQQHRILQASRIRAESSGIKDDFESVSLRDLNSLLDVEGGSSGYFIDPTSLGSNSDTVFEVIKQLQTDRLIDDNNALQLTKDFSSFVDSYHVAIGSWMSKAGISSDEISVMAESYSAFLDSLSRNMTSDRTRNELGGLFFDLATIDIENSTTATRIIPPWHPLKLIEQQSKAKVIADEVCNILREGTGGFVDAKLYFNDILDAITSNRIVEVGVFNKDGRSYLLSHLEGYQGFELLSEADGILASEWDSSKDNAVTHLLDTAERYINLIPHESSNLSVLLFDNQQNNTTTSLVEGLTDLTDTLGLTCDLNIYQKDPERLRKIYKQQNELAGEDQTRQFSREATTHFIAPLRVSMQESLEYNPSFESRNYDLVLLNQVFSTRAIIKWVSLNSNEVNSRHWRLDSISRKRPVGRGDQQKIQYLCDPIQSKLGQTYLKISHAIHSGESITETVYIPAYVINYSDNDLKETIITTHQQGEWVVCFDKLMDRELLKKCNVDVVRYSHDRLSKRNRLVSTTSNMKHLETMISSSLSQLGFQVSPQVISQIQKDACKLSGSLLMRALKQGVYAKELIGVVLSMALVKSEHHSQDNIAWFSLDEYAHWFGVSEEGIADILAIVPVFNNGNHQLKITITEAKFVSGENYDFFAKKSAKQLRTTMERISTSLIDKDRIDRIRWLQRISDMLLDSSPDVGNLGGWDIEQWAYAIRNDQIDISINGHSHVFVFDRSVDLDVSLNFLPAINNCSQEIFPKDSLSKLLSNYLDNEKLGLLRNEMMGYKDWLQDAIIENELKSESGDFPVETQDLPSDDSTLKTGNITGMTSEKALNLTLNLSDAENLTESVSDGLLWLPELISKWASSRIFNKQDRDIEDQKWLNETDKKLRKGLRSYGLVAEVIDSRLTPNAGLYILKGSDRLTVTSIEKNRSVLKTSHSIDILNIVEGLGQITIAVKRPNRAKLDLTSMWQLRKVNHQSDGVNLSLLVGARESDGHPLYLNIGSAFEGHEQHAPHTLIAGGTGSGKSVLVQNMLIDISLTNNPKDVEVYLIDPKMGVDYGWVDNIPHIRGDIITDKIESAEKLKSLAAEMDARYELFAKQRVGNLTSYNRKVSSEEKLPYIWIVHDEFADWMLDDEYKQVVSETVSRLGIKARAAGMYLVFIAQRPDKDVFPMQLRTNLGNRLILRVADDKTSVVSLDEKGAEKLLGKGHLAARLENEAERIIYAQVPFLDEDSLYELSTLIGRCHLE